MMNNNIRLFTLIQLIKAIISTYYCSALIVMILKGTGFEPENKT